MNIEQLEQMVKWIDQQIKHLNDSIDAAQQTNNYGRKLQYEGMREAFTTCLSKLNDTKEEKNSTKLKKKKNLKPHSYESGTTTTNG